jgi:hypothetical protein
MARISEKPPQSKKVNSSARSPDVVIFIPGLNQEFSPYPLEEVTLHLADALDNADQVAQAKYRVGDAGTALLSKSGDTQTATIFREHAGKETPVVKVYGMLYTQEFLGPYRTLPPLVKFLLLPLTILMLPWRRILFPGARSLTQREKLQFALMTFGLGLMFLYAVLLLVSIGSTFITLQSNITGASVLGTVSVLPATGELGDADHIIQQLPAWMTGTRASLEISRLSPVALPVWDVISAVLMFFVAIYRRVQAVSPMLAVWATAAGLLIPTKAQLVQAFDNGATVLVATIQYHMSGKRRPRLRGQLNALLQDVLEAPETANARVHILAYSFGSIVALDTIFRSDMRAPSTQGRIHSLVTVGSPFDVIHWMWPDYFRNRKRTGAMRWINIFAPQDVLSSNFLKEPKVRSVRGELVAMEDSAAHSVSGFAPDINLVYRPNDAADELSIIDIIRFVGLSSHNLYWERGKKRHSNALELAITELFSSPAPVEAV